MALCNLQVTQTTPPVEDWAVKTYHRVMGKHSTSTTNKKQPFPFHGVLAVLPLSHLPAEVSFRVSPGLGGFFAVVLHVFQNSDRLSTWLAFGFVWVACAIAGLACAALVFCVGETRKRLLNR
jgi:hypothetical protein